MNALALPTPYPLHWPAGRARTPAHKRERARYEVRTVSGAIGGIETEAARWRRSNRRITNWELTTNISGRMQTPQDPGAAFWFTLATGDATVGQDLMVLACDRFERVEQNIRAISLTMERLRLVDEIGAYSLAAAVEGAKALPPPVVERPWHEVLHVSLTAPLYIAEAAYRGAALKAGEGSPEIKELNRAIAEARQVLK